MKEFKPMLAVEAKDIRFPVYASAKLDGIRSVINEDMATPLTHSKLHNSRTTSCK